MERRRNGERENELGKKPIQEHQTMSAIASLGVKLEVFINKPLCYIFISKESLQGLLLF